MRTSIVAAALLALAGLAPAGTATRAAADRDVVVRVTGEGVVRSTPAGIACPPTCRAPFPTTQTVTLTASPASGHRLRTWSFGFGCEQEPTCQLPASTTAQSVDATFVPAGTLVLVPNGRGSIVVSPPGHDLATGRPLDRCDEDRADDDGGACRLAYVPGVRVAVAALPDPGSQFAGFSDFRCSPASCGVDIAAGEQTLTATFSPLLLRIRASGEGTIVSEPVGIDCRPPEDAGCSAAFPFRTPVTLTATGEGGQRVEWIFGCSPEGGNPQAARCATEVVSDPTWVVIRFGDADPPGVPSRVSVELTITTSGDGRVRGQKIDCGDRCEAAYSFGDRERLEAEPGADARFQGWEGGCGARTECEFPVGPITAVRALFAPLRLEARLIRAKVSGRRVHVRVSVARSATLTLRLTTRAGRRLASATRSLRRGQTTASVAVPRRLPRGRYRLVVLVKAGQEQARFARFLRIGR